LKAARAFHFIIAMFYSNVDWRAVKSSPSDHFIFATRISKMKWSDGKQKKYFCL